MTRQDFAEYVGGLALMTIVTLTLARLNIHRMLGLSRMEGAIICGGLSGFAFGELTKRIRRRAKARRRIELD